jgi:hypothetical protein
MVEKVITSPPNVLDFARYRAGRNAAKASAISARICGHCGAVLSEGEREDECSSVLNIEAASPRVGARKLYAD